MKLRPSKAVLQPRLSRLEQKLQRKLAEASRPPKPTYSGPPVSIGFDAEWVTRTGEDGFLYNEVLCVSAVLACGDGRFEHVFYLNGQERPSLKQLLQVLLRGAAKQKVVEGLPARVTFYGHFIRGDVSALADFWQRRKEFRGLGRTLTSGPQGHEVEMEEEEEESTAADEPHEVSQDVLVRLNGGQPYRVSAYFVDTMRLTPGQRGLAYAAGLIGRKKLQLHADLGVPESDTEERPELVGKELVARYGIARMDLVLRDYPSAFEAYALEDARIALEFGLFMEAFARDELGLRRLPRTLSGCAAAVCQDQLGGKEHVSSLLGREIRKRKLFNEASHDFVTRPEEHVRPDLRLWYEFGRESYHGGRNECFEHGPSSEGPYYDFDILGAYTTALADVRPLDYRHARQELRSEAFTHDVVGMAWITFHFPDATRYPCIPVRSEPGALIFPLQGRREDRVFATSPEIDLALSMGAHVEIIQGVVIPRASEERIFERFVALVQSKRREYPKATHPGLHESWKELGNSLYGLTAQGLREKRNFDPVTLGTKPITPSNFTEPFIAAWVTGLVRAVLGEILAGIPTGGRVISATTDGLLTNVPFEQLRLEGPLCSYFSSIRERLTGSPGVLDATPKHAAQQVVSIAIRHTQTARRLEGFQPVCAKGGVKIAAPAEVHNKRLLRLYLEQFAGMTVEHEQLISAREQLTREADLHAVTRTRRLNLRYDFKRRPDAPVEVALSPRLARIAWRSRPWRTVEEAELARGRVDKWSRRRSRVFRNLNDYRDWESYSEAVTALAEACQACGVKSRPVGADNAAGVLKRAFLQAGRNDQWGVTFPPRGGAQIARSLTEAGFETTKEDVTYAARRKTALLPHSVPLVLETAELLRVILRLFPTFDWRSAFRVTDHAAVQAALTVAPPASV